MLYHLFDYLRATFGLPGAGVFSYVTFRAAFALVIALLLSIVFGNAFIRLLKRKHISETQRDARIDPFNTQKKGVPTMGGVVLIVAILVPVLLIGDLTSVYLWLMVFTTLVLGAIGLADDYIKTFKKNKEGLNGWVKIAGQLLLGLVVAITLRFAPEVVMNESVYIARQDNREVVVKSPDIKSTRTTIPFFKNHNLNYADLFDWMGEPVKYIAGWVFFSVLVLFVIAAVSNGSNLNDGMDGMATGNSAIIGATLAILAYVSGHYVLASYFDLMYIPGSYEIVVFMSAFVGALIGFLWFNSYPAQIFMGDTGSLTIGGVIAVSAIIIHKELLLPVLCGVFLVESLSVILQRYYFKSGKKLGVHRRLWKRTPIHDHFRTSMETVKRCDPISTVVFQGNDNDLHHEVKITIRFWIITILLAALTLMTLKIR